MIRSRLKKLTLSGCKSFADESSIEFDERGLVLLAGDSGAGKSTVCLAVAYALGFCPVPSTELINWDEDSTLKVELTLTSTRGEVRIRRGATMSLWIDGVQFKGGTKLAEEKLHEVLGLSPEMMAALTYRGQRRPGLFLSMTDSEKKEFLTRLLGLDRFETAITASQAAVRDLEVNLAIANREAETAYQMFSACAPPASLEEIGAQVALASQKKVDASVAAGLTRETISSLEALRVEEGQAAAAQFEPQLENAKRALAAIPTVPLAAATGAPPELVQAELLLAQGKTRLERLEADDRDRLKASKATLTELNQKATELRKLVGGKLGVQKELRRLQAEMDALLCATCPTCERPWEHTQGKRAQIDAELASGNATLERILENEILLTDILAQVEAVPAWEPNPQLEKFRAFCVTQQQVISAENQKLTGQAQLLRAEHAAKVAEAKGEIHRLTNEQNNAKYVAEAVYAPQIQQARQTLSSLEFLISQATNDLATHRIAADRAKTQLEQRAVLEASVAKTTASRAQIETALKAEKDFLGLIGREGFLGAIFDEVLLEIADETNKILGTVANTRHCTISFKSESVTQKGTVKKSIVPVMSVGGHETSVSSGLSGGMLSSVELAVDLAVGQVISRRTGVTPGWLILDECFEGLPVASKESCMEILNQHAADRLVLVIDHATEFRALFTRTISVVHQDGRSSIAKE